MALTREQFDSLRPTIKEIEVSELGGTACIRTISARARDAYDNSINDGVRRDFDNISARLVCLCLCDDSGNLMFPDPVEGARVIAEWPSPVVERLFYACRDLNRMGRDALEEAAKNSEPIPADSSSTA
ncbi:MAG TPA: hypothetical protein VMY37_22925 [Thermoguttaceae bacterium]|nr:hypothetical protein [Thermoguttaceae bacterium]